MMQMIAAVLHNAQKLPTSKLLWDYGGKTAEAVAKRKVGCHVSGAPRGQTVGLVQVVVFVQAN